MRVFTGHRGNGIWFVLSGAVACFTLWVIYRYASNIPLGDQWWTPTIFVKQLHEGVFDLHRLFSQHNESRKAVTRLLWGYPIYWWGWNTRLELTLTWLSVVAISKILWELLKKTHDLPSAWKGPIFFTMNVLIFGLASWEYWVWSLSLEAYIPTLALVVCVLLARTHAPHWIFWSVTILCTLIAVFSYANGLFLIPIVFYIGILRFFSSESHRKALMWNGVWAGVALAALTTCIVFYFTDYRTPENLPGVREGLTAPVQSIRFLSRWLSGPYSVSLGERSVLAANVVGPLLLVVYMAILLILGITFLRKPKVTDSFAIWSPLLLFALISGAVTALSRGMMADNLFMWRSSRYVCFSVFAIVAALPMGFGIFSSVSQRFSDKKRDWFVGVSLSLVVLLSVINSLYALEILQRQKQKFDRGEQILSLRQAGLPSNIRLPKSQKGAPLAHQLKTADWMIEHGYLEVPEVQVPKEPGDAPVVKGRVGTFSLQPNGRILIGGWSIPYEDHFIVILGQEKGGDWQPVFCFPHVNKSRPDISQALNIEGFENSGFHWDIPAEFLSQDMERWCVMVWNSKTNQFFQLPKGYFPAFDG